MQFQNQYQRHYTYEVDSRGSSLEKKNDMYDYRNIEKLNNERINKLNFQLNHMNLPINNSIQSTSISSSNYLNKNNRLNNNINNTLNENNTNNQYESYKSYLDNKYNSEIPNNNLNQYSPLKKSKNQEEDFNEKYDVKPRRRGSSKSENMREYNNIDNENIDNNVKRIRSHSIGDKPEKNENFNLNIDDENKFFNEGNIYGNNTIGNNNELKTSKNNSINKNNENNKKKNVISETLLNPEYVEKVNNIKLSEGQINPNDYRNIPRYSNNSNALANMINNDKYSKINYLPQDSMNSNIRNKFNPNDNNNQYIDNNYNPLYNSQNNDLYQSNFTEPYQRNVINPFINNNKDLNNNVPYNSQIIGNNPYDSFNKYNQNFPNYSDPRFNNNNYPFNDQNQQFNNSNDVLKKMNNPYYENNNNNEDNDHDNILSQIEYINPDDIRNRPPNEQLYLLANNNKLLYNALKNLQEKYNNLKDEYLKLLKVQESVRDNPTFKDLLIKDNDELKRENKNYEKMIEPLVDYINDVNSSLGKKEIDLLDLKKLAKKYKEKKFGDDDDEMNPLDKFIKYINKSKDGIVNIVEGEPNKLKGKIPKIKERKRKIITFSNGISGDFNDNNNDLKDLKNPNEILKNDNNNDKNGNYNINNLKGNNPNLKKILNNNCKNNNYEDSDDSSEKNKRTKLNKNKKGKNKDFYYWKKNKFTRGKSGRIISDSDEEIQEEKKRINKFMIGDDKTYNYDYYNNRDWECPACYIGINNTSRGFSPLMCSPHRDYYIQNYENNNEDKNKENNEIETE